nr:MAG TPA: hypothetical protein [Caudoviricetes sp.]
MKFEKRLPCRRFLFPSQNVEIFFFISQKCVDM